MIKPSKRCGLTKQERTDCRLRLAAKIITFGFYGRKRTYYTTHQAFRDARFSNVRVKVTNYVGWDGFPVTTSQEAPND